MFRNTCLSWFALASTSGRSCSTSRVASTLFAMSWFLTSTSVDSRIGLSDWSFRPSAWVRANDSRFLTIVAARSAPRRVTRGGPGGRDLPDLREEVREPHDGGERVVQVVSYAGDQLTDRRHLLGLYELLLKPAPLALVVEHEDGRARLGQGNDGEGVDPVARLHLQGGSGRLGEGARHGIRPCRRQEGEPGAARDRGHGRLNQLGEDAVGATHHAVVVHHADGLVDRVDCLVPFPPA